MPSYDAGIRREVQAEGMFFLRFLRGNGSRKARPAVISRSDAVFCFSEPIQRERDGRRGGADATVILRLSFRAPKHRKPEPLG